MDPEKFSPDAALDLLDAIDAIVYVADLETYELLYLNEKARQLFGDGVGSKCWQVLQTGQTGPCDFCTNDKLFNEDGTPAEPYVWEFQNTVNGEWWECRDRVIRWTDGRYVRMEIATNVTEQKSIKQQLQESEERYRALYLNAPLPYQSLDEDGYFKDVNPAWLRTLGYQREDIIGKSFSDLLHPDWQAHFEKNFPAFKKRGYVSDVRFKIRHKDGHYLDISFEGCIGYTPDGDFKQTYCVFQDITSRVQLEQQQRENELKFRLLAEVTHDWEYWIDPDGNYKYISPACEKMIGVPPAELMENPKLFFDMVAPEDYERVCHHYNDMQEKQGAPHTIEFSVISRDGTRRILEHYCGPVHDEKGNFAGRIGNNRDITERRRAEEKIRSSEERLSFALKGAKCGLWDWNIATGKVLFDENYYRMAGYEPDEFPQAFEEWENRVHPDDIAETKVRLHSYLDGATDSFSTEFRFLKKTGGWVWILAQGEFVEWQEDGSPLRMTGLHIDIDDSKQAEADRMELEQQLRQKFKMEAVGTMAGGMAHNFNNSLAVILGNLEMAQRKREFAEKVDGYLVTAKTAALRSRDLVMQILSYSRMEAQKKKLIKISMVLDETQKMLLPTMPSSVDFRYQAEPDCLDLLVKASSGQIQEAILNLTSNALHAMDGRGRLQLSLERINLQAADIPAHSRCQAGAFVRISVTDTGGGIDPEVMNNIFDPFFTTKGVDKGTGIGLSSVQGIMEQHAGMVMVKNQPGSGCCFELYFPLGEGLIDSVKTENLMTPGGQEKILFVDDESQLAEVSAQMLTELGYQVKAETSSRVALELLQEQPSAFDLLITDQTMPELTGKDLALEIQKINPALPIILCTGYSNMISSEDARHYGVNAFCSKPLQLNELAQTVRKVLDTS